MATTMDNRRRVILFWAIFAVLVFARVFMFSGVPADINQDEAFAGYNTYTLLHEGKDNFGNTMPMYLTAWGSGMNALESYLAMPFVAIFGLHAWTIRLVPLLVSLLSLVTIYKLIREFAKNDILALFCMAFTGIMPWHIMISRWAMESNLAPGFILFGLYFFLKGLEKEKFFLLSAVFYGLSLYTYATIWIVLPFIILAQILYGIKLHRIRFSRYTILSVVILFVLALPAMLFLLVNKGVIDEIRTPIFTIPAMVEARMDEVSFSKIPENLKTLFDVLWNQNDGLIWNATDQFGLIYKFSIPFTFVGLFFMIKKPISAFHKWFTNGIANAKWKKSKKEKNKEPAPISLGFFVLVWLVGGLVTGALITVNINRVNIIHYPIIALTAYGVYMVFTHFSWIRDRLIWLPAMVYLLAFTVFEVYYFTEYKTQINDNFCEGIEETMDFVTENLASYNKVHITPNVNYARVLFYDKTDLDTYLDTVEYTNYPSPFLDVRSFGRYDFAIDTESDAEADAVYVLDHSYDGSPVANSLYGDGFISNDFGRYIVFYPK